MSPNSDENNIVDKVSTATVEILEPVSFLKIAQELSDVFKSASDKLELIINSLSVSVPDQSENNSTENNPSSCSVSLINKSSSNSCSNDDNNPMRRTITDSDRSTSTQENQKALDGRTGYQLEADPEFEEMLLEKELEDYVETTSRHANANPQTIRARTSTSIEDDYLIKSPSTPPIQGDRGRIKDSFVEPVERVHQELINQSIIESKEPTIKGTSSILNRIDRSKLPTENESEKNPELNPNPNYNKITRDREIDPNDHELSRTKRRRLSCTPSEVSTENRSPRDNFRRLGSGELDDHLGEPGYPTVAVENRSAIHVQEQSHSNYSNQRTYEGTENEERFRRNLSPPRRTFSSYHAIDQNPRSHDGREYDERFMSSVSPTKRFFSSHRPDDQYRRSDYAGPHGERSRSPVLNTRRSSTTHPIRLNLREESLEARLGVQSFSSRNPPPQSLPPIPRRDRVGRESVERPSSSIVSPTAINDSCNNHNQSGIRNRISSDRNPYFYENDETLDFKTLISILRAVQEPDGYRRVLTPRMILREFEGFKNLKRYLTDEEDSIGWIANRPHLLEPYLKNAHKRGIITLLNRSNDFEQSTIKLDVRHRFRP